MSRLRIAHSAIAVLLTAPLLMQSCYSGPFASRDRIFERGNALYREGKYEDAALFYRKALQQDDGFAAGWYQLGLCEAKRDAGAAYFAFRQAVSKSPQMIDAIVQMTDLEIRQYISGPNRSGKLASSITTRIDGLLAADPHSFDGNRLKGQLSMALGKPEEAVEFFQKALQVKPTDPGVQFALIQNLFIMKRDKEAFEKAESLMNSQSTFAPIYDLAYFHYSTRGQSEDAAKVLLSRRRNLPDDEQSHLLLARHYLRNGKREALASTEESLFSQSAKFPNAWLSLSSVHSEQGDTDGAKAILEQGAKRQPERRDLYEKRIALVLLAGNQFAEARRRIQALLARDPKDVDSRAAMAILKIRGRDPADLPEATAELERLLRDNPRSSTYLYNLALGQEARRDWRGARGSLRKLLVQDPSNLEALAAIARTSLRLKEFSDTIRYSQQLLEFVPNHEEAQLNLAVAEAGQGNLELANSRLKDLSKRFPENREIRIQSGLLAILKKQYSEAETILRRELNSPEKVNNDDLRVIQALAEIQIEQQRPDRALEFLETLSRAPGSSAGFELMAGQFATRLQRPDLASSHYTKAARLAPKWADPRLALGELELAQGNLDQARDLFRSAVSMDPSNPTGWALLGVCFGRSGQTRDAVTAYRRSLALNPMQPAVLNNIAYSLAQTGDNLDEAIGFVNTSLQQAPDRSEFADTLGMVYLRKGQVQAAHEIFRRLCEREPNSAAFRFHLGLALASEGQSVAAIGHFKQALELKPDPETRRQIESRLRGEI